MATNRLLRETNPPAARIASPVPQYKNATTGEYENAEGDDGAIYIAALTEKIVDLKSLLDNFGEVQASPTTNTLLERVKVIKTELDALQAQIGENTDAAVAAGAAGSIAAKMRRITTDIAAVLVLDFATQTTSAARNVQIGDTDAAMAAAGGVGSLSAKMRRFSNDLSDLLLEVGDTAAALVDAGAVGSLSAKMRRVTADLDAFKTNFDAKVAMETYGNGVPGAHTGEVVGAMYLDVTNGNIYASTGAAWVLKLEGIWV